MAFAMRVSRVEPSCEPQNASDEDACPATRLHFVGNPGSVTYKLHMFELRQTPVFEKWFLGLKDHQARVAIAKRLVRVEVGHFGDAKSLGNGVSELRIQHGPRIQALLCQAWQKGSSYCFAGVTRAPRPGTFAGPENWRRRSTMKTRRFDPAEHLETPEAQAELISEAFATGDPKFIAHALGTVARARDD